MRKVTEGGGGGGAIFHRGAGNDEEKDGTGRGEDQVSSSPLVNSFCDLSRSE